MPAYVNKRTAHRWKLLAMIGLGVFCAFGSFWLVQLMQSGDIDGQLGGPPDEPDYIVENFSFVRMTPTGQPRYVISGKRLEHIPQGDTSYVQEPLVRGVEPGHPPMTVHADRAELVHQEHRVELVGNVHVDRPPTPASALLKLRTDALTVLPDEEIMKTDKPLEMQLGANTMTTTGIVVNNATMQLHTKQRSRIITPPRAK